ncbi:MAG: hypothetical protein HDQ88_06790 [Clostridia bacterium]|nr:hypothetical protein [Clostridia bacterium]
MMTLLPIVPVVKTSFVNINLTDDSPKKMKVELNGEYDGMYTFEYFASVSSGFHHYKKDDSETDYYVCYQSNHGRDNLGIFVSPSGDDTIIDYLNEEGISVQYDGSNEWIPVVLAVHKTYNLMFNNSIIAPYNLSTRTLHVKLPVEYKGVYTRNRSDTGFFAFKNDNDIECIINNVTGSIGDLIHIRNTKTSEEHGISDDMNNVEIYGELELSKYTDDDKQSLLTSVKCVETMISNNNPNTTITHYCPIEESMNNITDFVIGSPVYLTGKVYKCVNNKFIPSTATDTTDCICSVKTNGDWNEFVGICVRIDAKNKCVTFSSGGDYLVRVNDTSCYKIGDEVFVDEGELKILTGKTALTAQIRRTTVGIVTSIVNKNMLAVMKS